MNNQISPSILTHIFQILRLYKQNDKIIIEDKLKLFIAHKDPYYLSDGQITIQARFLDYQNIYYSPYNKLRTKYYNTFKEANKILNCKDQLLKQPPPKYMTPYTPYYHFRQRIEQFKKDREKKTTQPFSLVIIKRWFMNTVNIANTGYYAPIITVLEFNQIGTIDMKQAKPTSILYVPQIIDHYLKLRALDVRKFHVNKPQPSQHQYELCYYIKDRKSKQNYNLQMINVDTEGKLLKFGTKQFRDPRTLKYIYFGNPTEKIEGTFCFKKPFATFQKSTQKMLQPSTEVKMNSQFLESAFRSRWAPQQQNESEDENTSDLLDSSEQNVRKEIISDDDDEYRQNSEQDDPLKKFYRKLLEQQKKSQNN